MIVDASALVDLLAGTARAEPVLQQLESAPHLAAPQLVVAEVANALWRLVRADVLASDAADRGIAALDGLRLDLIDLRLLLPVAWQWRDEARIADAFYLAAAARLDTPLLTTDAQLSHGHHGVPIVLVA